MKRLLLLIVCIQLIGSLYSQADEDFTLMSAAPPSAYTLSVSTNTVNFEINTVNEYLNGITLNPAFELTVDKSDAAWKIVLSTPTTGFTPPASNGSDFNINSIDLSLVKSGSLNFSKIVGGGLEALNDGLTSILEGNATTDPTQYKCKVRMDIGKTGTPLIDQNIKSGTHTMDITFTLKAQ